MRAHPSREPRPVTPRRVQAGHGGRLPDALALAAARQQTRTSVIVIETSYEDRVPGYESWWDVAVAEVSTSEAVKAARKKYEEARKKERYFF